MEAVIVQNRKRLEDLEVVIQKNVCAFYEVGRALVEIRDKGLYRDVLGYETFEAYCQERWDFKHSYASYLMNSARTIDNLKTSTIVEVLPTTESQTRPLAKLEPEQQREAWKRAVEIAPEGKVTAIIVAKVVRDMEPVVVTHKRIDKFANVRVAEKLSNGFKAAWDAMMAELQYQNTHGWKTTSKESASKQIQKLIEFIEREVVNV